MDEVVRPVAAGDGTIMSDRGQGHFIFPNIWASAN